MKTIILILIAIAQTFANEFEQSFKVKTTAVADAFVDDDSDKNQQDAKRPRHDQHETQISLPVPVTMVRPTSREN